jgi:hypothetical protein
VSPLSASDFRYTFGFTFDNVAGNNPAIPIAGNAIKNNLFYQNTGGDMYFYYTRDTAQSVLGNYYATASYNSTPLAAIAGNTISAVNPKFANVNLPATVDRIGEYDFHLQSGSPAIDKGVFLTTTTVAGSGSVIAVADASYFIDGFGIVQGDEIQLEGSGTAAMITAVDYTANMISVDKTLTWSSGQGVSLTYSGSAPDIGAYEYASGPKVETRLPNLISSGSVEYRVYNFRGRLVRSFKGYDEGGGRFTTVDRGLPSGVYLWQIHSQGRRTVIKHVVLR